MKKTISQAKLANLFSSIKGAKMCTIITETDPRMKKTNNPFSSEGIVKRSRMNVTINFSYENSVNNQRTKDGNVNDFEAQPRKWGQRINKTCLVLHNGNLYIEVKANAKPQSVEFINKDGVAIDKSLIQEFLPIKKSQAEKQGVEKEIILRDFALASIKEVLINGEHLVVA